MNKTAVQAKPVWAKNYANGSIDLPRSLPQPFSNTPEILSFVVPDDLKSYIKSSDFDVYEIATASIAILLHRFSAQDHFSLCTIRGSERPLSVPLSFSEETLSTDIMSCFKKSRLQGHECASQSHDVAILTEQPPISVCESDEGAFPHYNLRAKLIDFSFVEIDRKLVIEVAYNRRHIREWLVSRMMEALFTMLEDICTEKALPVRRLRLLSPTKLVSLRPKRAHDAELYYFPVIKMLEQMIRETPNAPAMLLPDGSLLNYAQLNAKVNRLANYLANTQLQNVPIGIVGSGTELTVIATLACLKLGLPYVSIPIQAPKNSMQAIIRNHAIRLCIIPQPITWLPVPAISNLNDEEIQACSSEFNSFVIGPEKIVGYYYTAGRGGSSRPVPITHKLVFDQFSALQQLEILNVKDRVFAYDGTGYIVSLHEFLAPLLNGATVVLASKEARQSAKQLALELNEKEVSLCYLRPNHLKGLIREKFFQSAYFLKKIFSYSAALCENDFLHVNNPDLLMNSYLLTELAGFVCYAACSVMPATVDYPVSLDDSRFEMMVVDEKNRLLPIGALGQVLLTVHPKDVCHLTANPSFANCFFEAELFGKKRLCFKTDDYGRWIMGKKFLLSHHRKRQVRVFDCHANLNELAHKVTNVRTVERVCALSYYPAPGIAYLVVFVVSKSKVVTERFMRDTFAALKTSVPNSIFPKMLVAVHDFDYTLMGCVDRNKMIQRIKEGNYISRLSFGSV